MKINYLLKDISLIWLEFEPITTNTQVVLVGLTTLPQSLHTCISILVTMVTLTSAELCITVSCDEKFFAA